MKMFAWVMLVPFGYIALDMFLKFVSGKSLNRLSVIVLFLSIFISAFCCAVLWGGLLE